MVDSFRGSFELEGIRKFRILTKMSVYDGPWVQARERKQRRRRLRQRERRSGNWAKGAGNF